MAPQRMKFARVMRIGDKLRETRVIPPALRRENMEVGKWFLRTAWVALVVTFILVCAMLNQFTEHFPDIEEIKMQCTTDPCVPTNFAVSIDDKKYLHCVNASHPVGHGYTKFTGQALYDEVGSADYMLTSQYSHLWSMVIVIVLLGFIELWRESRYGWGGTLAADKARVAAYDFPDGIKKGDHLCNTCGKHWGYGVFENWCMDGSWCYSFDKNVLTPLFIMLRGVGQLLFFFKGTLLFATSYYNGVESDDHGEGLQLLQDAPWGSGYAFLRAGCACVDAEGTATACTLVDFTFDQVLASFCFAFTLLFVVCMAIADRLDAEVRSDSPQQQAAAAAQEWRERFRAQKAAEQAQQGRAQKAAEQA